MPAHLSVATKQGQISSRPVTALPPPHTHTAAMAPTIKLTYWHIPGRAEVARLLLTLGQIEFIDNRIEFDQWPSLKHVSPFGQVPILELDGKVYAESFAINQYLAKLVGLMPADPFEAALADQAASLVEDSQKVVAYTWHLPDPQQQIQERQKLSLIGGPLTEKLHQLNSLVGCRTGLYLAGDKLSHGDLAVFNHLSTLKSGLWTGIPTDILDSYPALKAFRHQIASLPQVAAYYAQATDDTRKNGYTPDP